MRTSRYPPCILCLVFFFSSRNSIEHKARYVYTHAQIYIYIYFAEACSLESPHFYKKSLPLSNRKSWTNECQSIIRQCDVSECNTINRQWRRNVPTLPLLSYPEVVYKSSQYLFYYQYLETTSFDPSSVTSVHTVLEDTDIFASN